MIRGGPRIERAPGVAACVTRAAPPDASQGNASRRGASRAGPRDRPLTGQGEGEPEGGPASDRALDADLPAVGLDDGLADVQPQPQAAAGHPARRRALHLDTWRPVERLPHARLLSLRQPRPLVAHGHPRPTPMHLHTDINLLVLWGILHPVRLVIPEPLPDTTA